MANINLHFGTEIDISIISDRTLSVNTRVACNELPAAKLFSKNIAVVKVPFVETKDRPIANTGACSIDTCIGDRGLNIGRIYPQNASTDVVFEEHLYAIRITSKTFSSRALANLLEAAIAIGAEDTRIENEQLIIRATVLRDLESMTLADLEGKTLKDLEYTVEILGT